MHDASDPSTAKPLEMVSNRFEGDVLAGPLGDAGRSLRRAGLVRPPAESSTAQHVELAQLLLEPFSTALENDLRLREMAALREAAEADKRSLLTRLGRTTLGDTIVGVDSGLRGVMDRVELVARSDAPVLIFGETGTGKELVARAITFAFRAPPRAVRSRQLRGDPARADRFATVRSRAGRVHRRGRVAPRLVRAGRRRHAVSRRDRRACRWPPRCRMLRILQDGWMERVGGEKPINVDVRIVAATHRDLASMVAEGRFREDLWYRIAVFPIVLPPLRERREDIASLAVHFAERAATRFGLAPATPTPDDLARLTAYAWPGNVRELAAVIDRAAILGDGKRLEVAKALGVDTDALAVRHEIDSGWGGSSTATPTGSLSAAQGPNLPIEPLDVVLRRHIEAALRATHGRIEGRKGAAALLQINPAHAAGENAKAGHRLEPLPRDRISVEAASCRFLPIPAMAARAEITR